MRFISVRRSRRDPLVEGIEYSDMQSVLDLVAYGAIKIPTTKLSAHEFVISHEDGPCFGDDGFITRFQYRVLVAEILAKRSSDLDLTSFRFCPETNTYGLYTQILCILDNLCHINGVSRSYVRDRVTSAAFEGLLVGLARWDVSKVKADREDMVEAIHAHVSLWMRRYVSHELVTLRGEASGFMREAELTQREFFGSNYARLRAAARAYGDVWSLENQRPSVKDVLKEIDGKVTKLSVKRYVESLYGSKCLVSDRMPDQLTDDIRSVYRAIRSDAPKLMSSSVSFTQNTLESFDLLYKLRIQLFEALASHRTALSVLTPIRAEIIDVLLFSALSLDCDYTVSIGITFKDSDITRIKQFADRCGNQYYKDKALSRADSLAFGRVRSSVAIPSLNSMGSRPSSLCGVSYPVCSDGSFDSDSVTHLGGLFHKRSLSSRVALRVASRHALPVGPENVTLREYREILNDVVFVRNLIKRRGYLDPNSKNALQVIKEFYYLDSGHVIAAQRTSDGSQIFVRKSDGTLWPMVSWVPPPKVNRDKSVGFQNKRLLRVGETIEYLRKKSIYDRKCDALVKSGKMEKRSVYVRCSKADKDGVPVKTIRRFGGNESIVTSYYKIELRTLPVMSKVGDIVK